MKLTQTKIILWSALGIILVCVTSVYLHYQSRHPSTDNAYVGANVVDVAPQISGPISALYVKEFQFVKKGESLFDIDPAPFQVAVEKASAELDLAKQKVQALKETVAAAEASVIQRQVAFRLATLNQQRIMPLVKKKLASLSDGDKVTSDLEVAQAAANEAENQLLKAKAELGDPDKNNAEIRNAEAQLQQAKLNLDHTHVVSSADGYVINLTARVGAMAQAQHVLFSVIDASQWWVDANFKETQMQRIQVGQRAKIVVDSYPNHVFRGVVQDISHGSGSAFSVFPAENATGNWVKVTQRFTVRIRISDPDVRFPLRVGSSSSVTVKT